ncbi:hypothetical protein ACQR0V_14210 [Bradyrhizobium sp. HKCCYLS2058]|uniref:hypothetical protein n=1 Tax=Bradyrhizobium TaxID=374 RepID=UPI003EBFF0F7
MWVIALHFAAGVVAGTMFTVRTLLALAAIVFMECIAASIVSGLPAALYAGAGLVAVQVGYLSGIYVRSALERAGIAQPSIRAEHQR